jgi:hypothetical protein
MSSLSVSKTYWLFGFFVVLLLVVVFLDNDTVERNNKLERAAELRYSDTYFDDVTAYEIASSSSSTVVRLFKEGDDWMVSSDGSTYRVYERRFNEMLEDLRELSRGVLVSKTDDSWESFSVDEDSAGRLKAFEDDDVVLDVFIGKSGPSRNDTFLRWKGENEVFQVDGGYYELPRQGLTYWRDRKLFDVALKDIVSLTARNEDDRFSVSVNDEGVWTLEYEDEESVVAIDDVRKYIDSYGVSVVATGFFDEPVLEEVVRAAENLGAVFVELKGGGVYELVFANDKDLGAIAFRSDNGEVYRVGGSIAKRLMPEFLPEEEEEGVVSE